MARLLKKQALDIQRHGSVSPGGVKDSVLLHVNKPELGLLTRVLGREPTTNTRTGLLQFEPGGKSSDGHSAGHGPSGGGGVGGGGGTGNTGPGGESSPEGGGGSVTGHNPARDHSVGPSTGPGGPGTASINRSATNVGPDAPSPTAAPGETPGTTTDPTSWGGMLARAFHNALNPNPAVRALSTAATLGLGPPGMVVGPAIGLGTAMGEMNAKTISGVRDGSIAGSLGTDANGDTTANVGGSNYGGTATGTRGGVGTGSGGTGSGPSPADFLHVSTGQSGIVNPALASGMSSLGLLNQYQAPTQQQTIPGYGYTTPGYNYWRWG